MKDALIYSVTDRGVQPQRGKQCQTWRIELLDEKGETTDIWSDCWLLENGSWMGSYHGEIHETLIAALQDGFKSLLEYSGLDEEP